MLRDAIMAVPDWNSLPAEEVYDALILKNIRREDNELKSWAGIGIKLGQSAAAEMKFYIESALNELSAVVPSLQPNSNELLLYKTLSYAKWALDSGRLDFSIDDTQNALENAREFFASKKLPVDLLKSIGVWYEAIWQIPEYGIATEPTLQEVTLALNQLKMEETKVRIKQEGANRWNAFVAAVDIWDGQGEEPAL